MWSRKAPGTEYEALRHLYLSIPAMNFSSDVLSARPSHLAVIRARGLGWSDLGEPQRVFSVFRPGSRVLGAPENECLAPGRGCIRPAVESGCTLLVSRP